MVSDLSIRERGDKEICEILGISIGTWDSAYWRNTQGLRDFVNEIKKERVLRTVEQFSKDLMSMNSEENAKLKAIQQKEAEFLRETLLKELGYTKRIETIGLNINKNEPLDDEQKAKLDKIVKKTHNITIKKGEVVENGSTEPLNGA